MSLRIASQEDVRLCASVVKEIAQAKGIVGDPVAINAVTACVAKLYNRGTQERTQLYASAMEALEQPVTPPPKHILPDAHGGSSPEDLNASVTFEH